ncbi:hypothetical protein FQN51_001591 [Onygenales sp. PD_10]|nr:hypothetical protein FQN51_001591 [Onygenales sp. PD_10]
MSENQTASAQNTIDSSHPLLSKLGPGIPPLERVPTEAGGLYVALWARDINGRYHWGLYLACTATDGVLYDQIDATTPTGWKLAIRRYTMATSANLCGLLKVAVYIPGTGDTSVDELSNELRRVEIGTSGTCRTWVLAALFELAKFGWIDVKNDAATRNRIEWEAYSLAQIAQDKEVKHVARSSHPQIGQSNVSTQP